MALHGRGASSNWTMGRPMIPNGRNATHKGPPAVGAVGLITLLLCALASPPSSFTTQASEHPRGLPSVDRHDIERAIFDATNRQRMGRGLQLVAWEEDLAEIAHSYSRRLVGQYRLEHRDASGQGPSERVARQHRRLIGLVGENLAAFSGDWPEGAQDLAQEVVTGWMRSPGHRRNILRSDYTHMGVGLRSEGSELRITQLFAATQSYLVDDLPRRLRRGDSLSLQFEGPGRPEGVRLQPLGSSRLGERRQGPSFHDPASWIVDGPPGHYRLRFYFRQTAQRFSVIDGPAVEVVSSP